LAEAILSTMRSQITRFPVSVLELESSFDLTSFLDASVRLETNRSQQGKRCEGCRSGEQLNMTKKVGRNAWNVKGRREKEP
jgi:hypothetical protein